MGFYCMGYGLATNSLCVRGRVSAAVSASTRGACLTKLDGSSGLVKYNAQNLARSCKSYPSHHNQSHPIPRSRSAFSTPSFELDLTSLSMAQVLQVSAQSVFLCPADSNRHSQRLEVPKHGLETGAGSGETPKIYTYDSRDSACQSKEPNMDKPSNGEA